MSGHWPKLALTVALATLALGYVTLFAYFVVESTDYVVVRNNARARDAALATTPTLPVRFDFVAPSSDTRLLGSGWYRRGNGSVEAAGPLSKAAAFVYLPVPAGRSALLTMSARPFLAPGHELVTIHAWIDGTHVGSWTARYGEPSWSASVEVPASAVSDGLIEVRLDVEDEAAPIFYVEESRDRRRLGIRLESITLDPR